MITRIRLEATGRIERKVMDELSAASVELTKPLGGSWYTDEEHPPQVQTTGDGYWGYVWLKRVVTR